MYTTTLETGKSVGVETTGAEPTEPRIKDHEREFVNLAEAGDPEAVAAALYDSHRYLTLAGRRLVEESASEPVISPHGPGLDRQIAVPLTDKEGMTTYVRAKVAAGTGEDAERPRTVISATLLGEGASDVHFIADSHGEVRTTYDVWKNGQWHPREVTPREAQSLLRGLMDRMGEARAAAAILGPEKVEARTSALLTLDRTSYLGGSAVAA